MSHLARRRGRPRHGATPRRRHGAGSFDRWLDRLVDVAVVTALLVGATAMALTRWL